MSLSLLPICRAYRKEVDAELKRIYPTLPFSGIFFPSFNDRTIFTQASYSTICRLNTIDEYYPDGKTLEIGICYHWEKIYTIQRKEELMLSGFTNAHQEATFRAYASYMIGQQDYETLLIQHMQEQSNLILKKSGLSHKPCYFVFYIPRYATGLFYAVPIVSNDKIPDGRCFLQIIKL